MINYIIQVLIFQLLFLVVYDLFLKKETFFQWNRFYLILTSILAYVIPFIKINSIDVYVEKSSILPTVFINNNPEYIDKIHLKQSISTLFTIQNLYFLGLIIMSALFLYKIIQIILRINANKTISKKGYKLVLLNKENSAYSFFNYIFLGKTIYNKEHQHILNHELIHVKQKHSIDLLFFELQKIVFWFNPFSYLYQNRISTLHEYIADTKTINEKDKSSFFENLLQQTFNVEKISFVNNYYKQSLLKKRIIMATKNKSKQILKMKYLLILPLLLTMFVYTACSAQIVKKTTANEVKPPPPPPPPPSLNKVNGEIPPPPPPIQLFKETEGIYFSLVEKTPVFPGCEEYTENKDLQKCFQDKISSHIGKHFNMKLINSLGLKEGKNKIHTQFIINKKGDIENVMVAKLDYNKATNKVKRKEVHPKIVEEVKRIISILPQMKAGMQDGKAVKIRYNLPIAFKINSEDEYIGTLNGKANKQLIKKEKLKSIIIGSVKNNSEEKVIGFSIKIPNYPTYKIKGNKLDKNSIDTIKNSDENSTITIFKIFNNKSSDVSSINFQIIK